MTDDKYIKKKVNPIIEDVRAVWKLDKKDDWLKSLKEEIGNAINKAYADGFQDGHEEGINEEDKESFGVEPDTSLKEGLIESRG